MEEKGTFHAFHIKFKIICNVPAARRNAFSVFPFFYVFLKNEEDNVQQNLLSMSICYLNANIIIAKICPCFSSFLFVVISFRDTRCQPIVFCSQFFVYCYYWIKIKNLLQFFSFYHNDICAK